MRIFKNIIFVWSTITAITTALLGIYIQQQDLILDHKIDIGLLLLTIISTAFLFILFLNIKTLVLKGFLAMEENQIRSDVDRFFKSHKKDSYLSEDEAKYLGRLKDKVKQLNINSFTERQIKELDKIEIK